MGNAHSRLLILTPTAIVHGGVERIVEALNDGLPARGFEVTVGLAKGARFHDAERYRLAYPSLRAVELDARTGTPEARRRAIGRALDGVSPDVVLIARLSSALEVLAERKARGEKIRVAFAIRSFEPNYFIDLSKYGSFIDLCVVDGRLCAEAAEELCGFPKDRIRNIPGGVRSAARFVERDGAAPVRLGYVGRLESEQKRVLDLARILRALADRGLDFSCVIAGEGPAEESLRASVRSAGLERFVNFAGPCDPERLDAEIYPSIEIFLHCAAWEGVTIAPREAMAHGGVPVIARFQGLASEGMFLDGQNCRTFPVGDAEAAASLVEELARDRQQWRRLSHASRESQTGIRSFEGALDAWAESFRDALARPVRSGKEPLRPGDSTVGRLDRLFGEKAGETARRLLGLRFRHSDPGGEWPHWTGGDIPELRRRIEEFARQVDVLPAKAAAR